MRHRSGGLPKYLVVLTFIGLGLLVAMLAAVMAVTYWPSDEPTECYTPRGGAQDGQCVPQETIQCFQSLTGTVCELRPVP